MNADELKKAEEIVRALRCNDAPDEDDNMGCANKKCKYRDVDSACDIVSMCQDAADLIDSLTAQLTIYQKYGEPCDWRNARTDEAKIKQLLEDNKQLMAEVFASQRREKAAEETLTAIFEHIDRDEYLRKEFCIHLGREDCPSEAANGYVDVDDCCGCPLFVNSYSAPQKAEKGDSNER